MLFNRLGLFVVAGVLVFSSLSHAQESDYNDVLKETLKEDAAPPPPPKRVVKKRIKKVVKKSTLPAKTTKVAQNTDSTAGTVSVKANNVQPAEETENVPSLGESTSNTQKYSYQQQPYQPIFILQPNQLPPQYAAQAPAAAPVGAPVATGQVQPTTNVDSTAVPEPKSEQLRHQREDMEHQTENKLIEKLEDDRLKSEKDRADRLFAAPVVAPSPNPAPSAAPVAVVPAGAAGAIAVEVPPQPAPSAAPVAAAVAPAPPAAQPLVAGPAPAPAPVSSPAPEVVKSDVNAVAVIIPPGESGKTDNASSMNGESTAKVDDVAKKDEDEKRFSVGALAGVPSYPSASNIAAQYTLGAMGTYKFDSHFSLQAGFDYSKFNITNSTYCPFCYSGTLVAGLNQYDVVAGMNYSPLTGNIRPIVGADVDYARRNYNNQVSYGYGYTGLPTGSNAMNAGLMAGVDVNLSKSIILGFQFQYFWNISYWTDNPLAYGLYGNLYGPAVESLGYYLATLNLRFMF